MMTPNATWYCHFDRRVNQDIGWGEYPISYQESTPLAPAAAERDAVS